jgi:hypothetical protein
MLKKPMRSARLLRRLRMSELMMRALLLRRLRMSEHILSARRMRRRRGDRRRRRPGGR